MKFISDITVRLINHSGGDTYVVAAAKVSTNGQEAASFIDQEANFGLINYLLKQKHGTPFEHGALTFFTHAPIFVYREWHRHRIGMSYNEESGRYKQLEPTFWIPRRDRKIVPVDGYKAARPQFQSGTDEQYDLVVSKLKESYTLAYKNYTDLLSNNIAKEVSRACLPVGIYSSCWVTCNPRSLMHFLSLRTHEEQYNADTKTGAKFVSYPQVEIEEAARATEKVFATGWPLTYKAFCENGRIAP